MRRFVVGDKVRLKGGKQRMTVTKAQRSDGMVGVTWNLTNGKAENALYPADALELVEDRPRPRRTMISAGFSQGE